MLRFFPFRNRSFGRLPRSALVVPAAAALSLTACETGPRQTAFIDRLGTDTMAIEVYTRTADRIEGDVLVRSPVTRVAHYVGELSPEGTISRFEVAWKTPAENPEGPPPQEFTVTMEGDSATVERKGGETEGTMRVATPPGTIPVVGTTPITYAVLEQAVKQAIAEGADSLPLTLLSASGRMRPNALVRHSTDSVSVDFFGSPMVASVESDGRVSGRSGEQTTMKVVGERVSRIDVDNLASDFAARDARGEGLGVPSPGATLEKQAGGANFEVVYSRPATRGREIFGGLVPWNEVWRTGANAATIFTTDRNLVMGDARIPAGSYTLWTIFTPESATLIINSQTGQWGTAYDATQDFVRVPLTQETLSEPVERFAIDIEEADGGAVLQLSWDTSRFSIPMTVR
jgi:hypothetical protein